MDKDPHILIQSTAGNNRGFTHYI